MRRAEDTLGRSALTPGAGYGVLHQAAVPVARVHASIQRLPTSRRTAVLRGIYAQRKAIYVVFISGVRPGPGAHRESRGPSGNACGLSHGHFRIPNTGLPSAPRLVAWPTIGNGTYRMVKCGLHQASSAEEGLGTDGPSDAQPSRPMKANRRVCAPASAGTARSSPNMPLARTMSVSRRRIS